MEHTVNQIQQNQLFVQMVPLEMETQITRMLLQVV